MMSPLLTSPQGSLIWNILSFAPKDLFAESWADQVSTCCSPTIIVAVSIASELSATGQEVAVCNGIQKLAESSGHFSIQ